MIKLVIVEDDLMVAAINREFALKTPELNIVATFYNGHEALEFLSKHSIDLLLLDVYLAGCSGLEILTELRRQGNLIDVIIISAADDALRVGEAFHLGIIDYLIKPFTYERFNDAVQKFLLRRSLQMKGKYTQEDIDKLLRARCEESVQPYTVLGKGLQQNTLEKILECLFCEKNFSRYLTSEQISEETKLSKMTVRRYMNYLIEQKEVVSRVNYATGGRPSIEYKIVRG